MAKKPNKAALIFLSVTVTFPCSLGKNVVTIFRPLSHHSSLGGDRLGSTEEVGH
jgi:hypothetical protein